MDQNKETEIIRRILEGDRQTYALLVEEYKSPIYNLAYRMTSNTQDAADLTQDIFIRAYTYLWRYNPRKKFFNWLYTIALNQIKNHLKKIRKQNSSDVNNVLDVQKQSVQNDFKEENDIEVYLAKLDDSTRALIIMKYYQELSFEEIAKITGKNVSAIKMKIYRGLDNLKNSIKR